MPMPTWYRRYEPVATRTHHGSCQQQRTVGRISAAARAGTSGTGTMPSANTRYTTVATATAVAKRVARVMDMGAW